MKQYYINNLSLSVTKSNVIKFKKLEILTKDSYLETEEVIVRFINLY